MSAFLSIDLDFGNVVPARTMTTLFDKVAKLHLPIHVACFHDQLLPFIDESNCDTVHNIDYHSDLADLLRTDRKSLNEGTWGAFPACKSRGKFVWHYPSETCFEDGFCHGDGTNPFTDPEHGGWSCVRMEQGLRLPWASIRAVGVCLSPDWTLANVARPLMERLKMPLSWFGLHCWGAYPDPIISLAS